jgi:hypothetical protein
VQQPDASFLEKALIMSQGEIDFVEISNAMERLTQQLKSKTVGAIYGLNRRTPVPITMHQKW